MTWLWLGVLASLAFFVLMAPRVFGSTRPLRLSNVLISLVAFFALLLLLFGTR